MLLLVMVEVVLVIGIPTYPHKNIVLDEAGTMWCLFNISLSAHNPPRRYLGVGIVQLVLMIVLCLVLLMGMLKVVWVLVSTTLTPRKLMVVLMVVILCCQGVGKCFHE